MMIGALDHPENIRPASHDSIESRMPWFSEIATTPDSGTLQDLDGPERFAGVAASNRQHPDHDTDQWPKP